MPLPNLNTLNYQGLKESNPPDIYFRARDPLPTDYKLYDLLDLWQNTITLRVFILLSKTGNVALWVLLAPGAAGALATLNGVAPVANNINLVNTGAIDITTGVGIVGLGVKVDGITIGIVGDQLTVLGSSGFTWIETAVGLTMAVNTGYVANGGVLVNLTLPAVASFGSEIRIAGKGAGLWQMTANAGQMIHFGNQTTAIGGNILSTQQRDTIHVVCITANTEWEVLDDLGNFFVT